MKNAAGYRRVPVVTSAVGRATLCHLLHLDCARTLVFAALVLPGCTQLVVINLGNLATISGKDILEKEPLASEQCCYGYANTCLQPLILFNFSGQMPRRGSSVGRASFKSPGSVQLY